LSNECLQIDVCEKSFENINEKIKVSNNRLKDLENKIEEVNSIKNVLVELQLLTKLQREDSIKRDKAIEDMNRNQIEITNTLKTLSENLNKTDINVDKLAEKVDINNIQLNKKVDDISNDNIIKLSTIGKYLFFGTLGSGMTILLTRLLGN